MKSIKESYNKLPYKSNSYPLSNPNRLKFVSKLLGFDTKELENCRVLEIGCSYGGNIIPFAVGFEKAEVFGIDISSVQINKGNEIINEIGIDNIKLYEIDIMDYNNELGKFDYIICHGVYSWVPKNVQNKILQIIKKSLSKNGVAYVSYNSYPGWKYLDIYRDAMLFRKNSIEKIRDVEFSEKDSVSLGRGLVEFIVNNSHLEKKTKKMGNFILNEKDDYYIYHEYFEEVNNPKYLYEFNKELEENGLYHFIDSSIKNSFVNEYSLKMFENDYISMEQYMDFINNIQFRSSVITHIENKNKISNINCINIKEIKGIYVRKVIGNPVRDLKLRNLMEKVYPEKVPIEDIINNKDIDFSVILDELVESRLEVSFKPYKKTGKKLKKRYDKYFKYFYNTQEELIDIASSGNSTIPFNKKHLHYILENDIEKLDGKLIEILSYFDMLE